MHQIISNKVQCLSCGDIIESRHRHDFVSCKCGATSVDGGYDYARVLGNTWKDMLVTTSSPFEVQREAFSWKSYGKDGKQKPTTIPLKNLTSDHIQAILDTQVHIAGTWVEKLLRKELEYREKTKGN